MDYILQVIYKKNIEYLCIDSDLSSASLEAALEIAGGDVNNCDIYCSSDIVFEAKRSLSALHDDSNLALNEINKSIHVMADMPCDSWVVVCGDNALISILT